MKSDGIVGVRLSPARLPAVFAPGHHAVSWICTPGLSASEYAAADLLVSSCRERRGIGEALRGSVGHSRLNRAHWLMVVVPATTHLVGDGGSDLRFGTR